MGSQGGVAHNGEGVGGVGADGVLTGEPCHEAVARGGGGGGGELGAVVDDAVAGGLDDAHDGIGGGEGDSVLVGGEGGGQRGVGGGHDADGVGGLTVAPGDEVVAFGRGGDEGDGVAVGDDGVASGGAHGGVVDSGGDGDVVVLEGGGEGELGPAAVLGVGAGGAEVEGVVGVAEEVGQGDAVGGDVLSEGLEFGVGEGVAGVDDILPGGLLVAGLPGEVGAEAGEAGLVGGGHVVAGALIGGAEVGLGQEVDEGTGSGQVRGAIDIAACIFDSGTCEQAVGIAILIGGQLEADEQVAAVVDEGGVEGDLHTVGHSGQKGAGVDVGGGGGIPAVSQVGAVGDGEADVEGVVAPTSVGGSAERANLILNAGDGLADEVGQHGSGIDALCALLFVGIVAIDGYILVALVACSDDGGVARVDGGADAVEADGVAGEAGDGVIGADVDVVGGVGEEAGEEVVGLKGLRTRDSGFYGDPVGGGLAMEGGGGAPSGFVGEVSLVAHPNGGEGVMRLVEGGQVDGGGHSHGHQHAVGLAPGRGAVVGRADVLHIYIIGGGAGEVVEGEDGGVDAVGGSRGSGEVGLGEESGAEDVAEVVGLTKGFAGVVEHELCGVFASDGDADDFRYAAGGEGTELIGSPAGGAFGVLVAIAEGLDVDIVVLVGGEAGGVVADSIGGEGHGGGGVEVGGIDFSGADDNLVAHAVVGVGGGPDNLGAGVGDAVGRDGSHLGAGVGGIAVAKAHNHTALNIVLTACVGGEIIDVGVLGIAVPVE